MNGTDEPKPVSLFFAVLDGSDPTAWQLYGKKLPQLMKDACNRAKPEPRRVRPGLLHDYNVKVELMWSGPDTLRRERSLDGVVGVIIDAFPRPDADKDRAQKISTLREHVRHVRNRRDAADSLCGGLKYSIWLMTDSTTDVAEFKASVEEAAGRVMGSDRIDPQVLENENWFALHLKSYIEYIYYELGRGCYTVDPG